MWFLHLASAVLLAFGLALSGTGNRRLDFVLYLVLAALLPLYGAVAAVLLALYQLFIPRDCAVLSEYSAYIHPDEEIEKPGEGGEDVDRMVRHELNIQPYMDIMRGSDMTLKRALIRRIIDEWTPNAVALLKVALADEDYEIRSFASSALTAIENAVNRRIHELQAAVADEEKRGEALVKLAGAYIGYARIGLLDAGSRDHYLRKAEAALQELEADTSLAEPVRLRLLVLRGECAALGGRFATAREWYARALELRPDHEEALTALCQIDFAGRNYAALQDNCRRLIGVAADRNPVIESAELWIGVRRSRAAAGATP